MSDQYWGILARRSQEIVEARLAEAERDRLVRRALGPSPSARARLASALRAVANRLEGGTLPAAERQLGAAAGR
jgi:hypothetical protein